MRGSLFQGVADLVPACAAFIEQVFVADFAFDVGPVERLPQFQAFVIHGLGFFGEFFAVQVVAHEMRLESAVKTHLRFVVRDKVVGELPFPAVPFQRVFGRACGEVAAGKEHVQQTIGVETFG